MGVLIYKATVNPQVSIQGITLNFSPGVTGMLFATVSKLVLSPGNTQNLQVFGVYDNVLQTFWSASGSITGNLIDSNGYPVAECTNVILAYQPGNAYPGTFSVSFGDQNFQPAPGTQYTLVLDGVQNGVTLHLELLVEVAPRAS